MTPSPQDGSETGSPAEFRRLMVQLGIAAVAAGGAVDLIEDSLRRVVATYGVAGLQIALLPTSLFVQTGTGDSVHVQFSSQVAPPMRLDQIDGLYRLARRLERGELSPAGCDSSASSTAGNRPFGGPCGPWVTPS